MPGNEQFFKQTTEIQLRLQDEEAYLLVCRGDDLVAEACLAIRSELTAEELGNTVHGHPAFAESWMEAAHAVHGSCVHAPPAQR